MRYDRLPQFGLEQTHNRFDQTFAGLQNHVAGETVADDYVNVAGKNVTAFDVADEVDRRILHQLQRLFGQIVSLDVFFADAHQSDFRTADAQDRTRVDRTHNGELL